MKGFTYFVTHIGLEGKMSTERGWFSLDREGESVYSDTELARATKAFVCWICDGQEEEELFRARVSLWSMDGQQNVRADPSHMS